MPKAIIPILILSFTPLPVSAVPVVNAATVFRSKCKATPPEYRSAKCRRLVGNN